MFKRERNDYGKVPEPETPYQKAAQAWDDRIGSARVAGKELAADGALPWAGLTHLDRRPDLAGIGGRL